MPSASLNAALSAAPESIGRPTLSCAHDISAILGVNNLTVRFGGVLALDGVSFDVGRGHICGLIGPNGAGKTTLFNCLSRLYSWSGGSIAFEGKDLLSVPVHGIAALGIGRTFQNLALFRSLSVTDNVMIGGHCRTGNGFVANALRLPSVGREDRWLAGRVSELLRFVKLQNAADRLVGDLPFGVQKRVELARALAAEPKLLLLDEPAAGLNHEEIGDLRDLIWRIRDELGVTVLLVEHHMSLVMKLCDRVVVLNFGRKIAEGAPQEVQSHPEVIRAYLGKAPA